MGSSTGAYFRVGTIHVCLDGEQDAMALHCAVDVALMLLNLLKLVCLYISGAASTSASPARPSKAAQKAAEVAAVHRHLEGCAACSAPESWASAG